MVGEVERLRDWRPGDLQAMAAIERRAHAWPWSLNQFLGSSLSERDHGLVLELPGVGLVGFCVYQRVLDEATLLNIAVDPDWQGGGRGRRLLGALLQRLAGCGVRRCLLEVRAGNSAAIRLYRQLGFLDDGVRAGYYPAEGGREDALLMSCELTEPA